VIVSIEQPELIARILAHRREPGAEAAPVSPLGTRAPPGATLGFNIGCGLCLGLVVRPAGRLAGACLETPTINEIGHLTGKPTITEWSENAEIIEVLRGLGVDYAQGYGVSQPQRVQRAAIA
jgi:hypothetical protein